MNDPQALALGDSEPSATFGAIAGELLGVERQLRNLESEMSAAIEAVPLAERESARNLVHYVALRQRDLRDLQANLAENGLSSLGRSESCVMGSLLEVSLRQSVTNDALLGHHGHQFEELWL